MGGERIYVTGIGILSALGGTPDQICEALLTGRSGIGRLRYLSTCHAEFPVGEVNMSNGQMASLLNLGEPHANLRTVMLGILAARSALRSAGLSDLTHTAFVNGTTVGGMDNTEYHFHRIFSTNGEEKCLELQYNDCGCSTRLIVDKVGRFNMATTISTACSSAANAIATGADLIRSGIVDIAVAGGSESLSRFHLNGFNSLMILDNQRCRPFDINRSGINLGEGAAYLVLESEDSVRQSGRRPLAILSGYANACDAFHQTATSDNGEGAYLSMTAALADARLKPDDIDYVNAHGTGTPNNDISELAAMKRVWKNNLPPYSSTKPFTGHTTSASGSIESAICILAMCHGFIPPSLGVTDPIDTVNPPVTEPVTGVTLRHVVCNSFGFGGNDTTLVFSNPDLI